VSVILIDAREGHHVSKIYHLGSKREKGAHRGERKEGEKGGPTADAGNPVIKKDAEEKSEHIILGKERGAIFLCNDPWRGRIFLV